jgi:predicted carbohydrate-binding protein with CBM5 and CBM33 domain
MISLNVLGDWHTLDTLNGYYRLVDLFNAVGKPAGKSPENFVREVKHPVQYSIQVKKHVWANQDRLYAYAAYIDPAFADVMNRVLTEPAASRRALARTIATGVIHK